MDKDPKLVAADIRTGRAKATWALHFTWLLQIFRETLLSFRNKEIYCILDGLDECDDTCLQFLLHELRHLATDPRCPLRLLIFSHPYPDFVEHQLSGILRLNLDTDPDAKNAFKRDVDIFVEETVATLKGKYAYNKLEDSTLADIKRLLLKRSQESFLWVGYAGKEVLKVPKTKLIPTLQSFPKDVKDLFERIIEKIPTDERAYSAQTMNWVAFSFRPMTTVELIDAIEIPESDSVGITRGDKMKEILACLDPVLTIQEQPGPS